MPSSTPTASDGATRRRMKRQRKKDTAPELAVRRVLRARGHHYRLTPGDLPGSPDIAHKANRWAIFVHGCYWHHHEGCKRATLPRRNREWWARKFEKNRERDRLKEHRLREQGFRVLVIWECQTRNQSHLHALLDPFLPTRRKSSVSGHTTEAQP